MGVRGVFQNRSLLFLAAGQTVSLLGIAMSAVALPWYVLTTTGSPGRMAAVLVAQTLPYALFGLPAGALVDRMNLKRLMVGLDLGRAVVIGLIPILAAFGILEYWMIVALAFVSGLLSAPYQGARLAIVPAVVGEDEKDLASANTFLQSAMYATSIAGPVLAGLLIPVVGNGTVILIDAISYAVAAVLIGAGMSYVAVPRKEHHDTRLLQEMSEGLRYAWGHSQVRLAMILGALAGLGFWLILDAALPVFTRDVLMEGPETLGFLVGLWGVGAALGILGFGLLDRKIKAPRMVKLAVSLSLMAGALVVPPASRSLIPVGAGLLLAGVFDAPSGIMVQTILQHQTPARLRGRVSTAFYAIAHSVAPAGLLIAGPVMERWGSVPILWAVALTFGIAALTTWRLVLSDPESEYA